MTDKEEDEEMENEEQDQEQRDEVVNETKPEWKIPLGTDAGLTLKESSEVRDALKQGTDSPLLDDEVPTGEYAGLTRREAHEKHHAAEGVFPELTIRDEMDLTEKFHGEIQRGPDGEWLRDAKGHVLPRVGIDRSLPIFDTPVPSGMWQGFTRAAVLTAGNGEPEDVRPYIEREILALVPTVPERMAPAAREMIRDYLCGLFVDAEREIASKTKYGTAISDDGNEFDDTLKELDVDLFDTTLINQVLAGKITLDQATQRERVFAARFIALLVSRREPVPAPATSRPEPSKPLGGTESNRGEIRDELVKFYREGGVPAQAWRPGDLFVLGCDKSFAYKIYRKNKWREF